MLWDCNGHPISLKASTFMLSTVESFDRWESLKYRVWCACVKLLTVSANYKSTGYNGFIEREFVDHQSFLNIDYFFSKCSL